MNPDLTHIIHGYSQGYFLMNNEDDDDPSSENLGWYCSNERTLIPLDSRFRYPKSLQRVLNQERFSVAINRDFPAVVEGCANRESTWISPQLKDIYLALHHSGWAHSFETWQGDRLAGGILGIAIGAVFIGESMFFNIPDGSKVAMVKLVEHLRQQKFQLFDVQLMNPHLARFGAHIIDDPEYKELLQDAIHRPCRFVP
ncbi:MAG: leucyl/phenylalanyl-tRNA--protein transferase [Phormidium sp. GEM2.Bin31]|nr:MAG: leucyl/phenylalanyl-tRNA--protein transferase [Phormidium sp. GEM2.Bin31]